MLAADDFILPVDVVLVARREQPFTVITAKAIEMVPPVGRRANEEIVLGEGLMTLGTFRDKQSRGEKTTARSTMANQFC